MEKTTVLYGERSNPHAGDTTHVAIRIKTAIPYVFGVYTIYPGWSPPSYSHVKDSIPPGALLLSLETAEKKFSFKKVKREKLEELMNS